MHKFSIFVTIIFLCSCESNRHENDLVIVLEDNIQLRLGQSRHEIEKTIGEQLELSQTSIVYLSAPNEKQIERDIVAYAEMEYSKNRILYFGFNANDILIEFRYLEISKLYQDQD